MGANTGTPLLVAGHRIEGTDGGAGAKRDILKTVSGKGARRDGAPQHWGGQMGAGADFRFNLD